MANLLASVVVIAYDRKQYILEAIHSVLNQPVDRNEYEIIVIKNFYDEEIDRFLENQGILCISSHNRSLSGKMAESLIYANGEYLCFLEDDDFWSPLKLASFFSLLRKYGKIDFYHNGNVHFRRGENTFWSFRKIKNIDSVKLVSMKEANYSFAKYNKLIRNKSSYNLSSMIIKTDLLRFHVNTLSEFGNDFVDSLIFYISALFGSNLLIDRRKLTAVRVHSANRSGLNLGIGSNAYREVFNKLLKSTESQVIRRNLFQLLSRIKLDLTIKDPKCTESAVFRCFVSFISHSVACHRIPDIDMLVKSLFRLFGRRALAFLLDSYHS